MFFINYGKIDSSHSIGRTKAPVTRETVVNTCDLLLAPVAQFYPDLNSQLDDRKGRWASSVLCLLGFWAKRK